MALAKPRRQRGVVLTLQGWQKLDQARRESAVQNSSQELNTFEALSERTDLDARTVARVLERQEGVDKRTLDQFFRAFNLELDTSDYAKANSNFESSEGDSATLDAVITNTRQDLREAVDVSIFYGRTEEITTLDQWIVSERCRLVALLGMGGIGKTTLSAKLAEQLQNNFEYVIWRSLRDAPPVKAILANLLQFLSDEQETEADLPESISDRVLRLLDRLRSSRCLLILDSVEAILRSGDRAGQYREGYEGYGELLKQVGEAFHQSCLVLTSREKPQEVASLEGQMLPVRSLRLSGLKEEGQEILRAKGLSGGEDELEALTELYAGNPLALKIVATTIQDVFGGNIAEFLNQGTAVFGDIRNLLDQQFERLADLEKEIMYWLAINREPISLSQLQDDIVFPVPQPKLLEAMESLGRRSLLETNAALFTLQPVVMEYVIERAIEQVCEEVTNQKLLIFKSHALLKAQSKDYIRDTQVHLILQSVVDGLFRIFGNKINIQNQLNQILAKLQTESIEPGYTGGNAINLLCQMQTDLNGCDFSHLTVWQANLRNVHLHNTNFQHVNLAKSVFAETFGGILSVAFSPDGTLLATGDDTTGEIRLYQVRSGKQILSYKGHTGWVWSVTFSPNGQIIASGGIERVVMLWDVRTGQCLRVLEGHSQSVGSVAFSPDGHTIASSSDDQTVKFWDVSIGQCIKTLPVHPDLVRAIAFSPDGQILAGASDDHTIKLWHVSNGRGGFEPRPYKILQGHTDWIESVSFSPDGRLLASGSVDKTVRVWDVSTGVETLHATSLQQGHRDRVRSVVFSPNGQTVMSGSEDQTVKFWDVQTGKCLMTLQGHTKGVWSVALSPNGQTLASGSEDQSVRLYDVNAGRYFRTLQGYSNRIRSVAFDPQGNTLVSGNEDQTVRLWDVSTGQCLRTMRGHSKWVWSVAFSPDGQTVVSGSQDQTVRLWDISTGQCFKILHVLEGHTDWVWFITLSPDGRTLASASADHTVKLWDISTGQCIRILQGHTNWVRSISFSPDGQTLISGSQDETIKLWDISTGQCLKILQADIDCVWSVAFSPQGNTLASGGTDHAVRLWDADTGECLLTLQGHTDWVWSVAFSPDGRMLASSSVDQTVRLWDVSTALHDGIVETLPTTSLHTLQGHCNRVYSVTFSPDGQILASSSEDETVKLWDVTTGECLRTLVSERPYEGMNITGVTGINEVTVASLKALGAVEYKEGEAKP